MFGMTSKDFWENDPQLYWSYRTFYLKKLEEEELHMKYSSWLNGTLAYTATSIALNNAFSKKKEKFPTFNELFDESSENSDKQQDKNKKKTSNEINKIVQEEFNMWARY